MGPDRAVGPSDGDTSADDVANAPPLPRPAVVPDWHDRFDAIRQRWLAHDRGVLLLRLIGAFAGLAFAGVVVWWFVRPVNHGALVDDAIPLLQTELVLPSPEPTDPVPIRVHVAGAVAVAGVVELVEGDRVEVAVAAAGGALGDADLDRINLARTLADGERIYVPRVGEPVVAADDQSEVQTTGPVDLNLANAADLEALPGVGPATAEKIISHRDANGPFITVSGLEAVPGIGPAKLEQLRDLVVVR